MLQSIIHSLVVDNSDVSFHNNYSGRGMYSGHCIGISGTESSCRSLIADAVKHLQRHIQKINCNKGHDTEFEQGVDELLSYSTDKMGLCGVIYYWPSIPPIESNNPVWNAYLGRCPDCGNEIPLTVNEGESCLNCGHRFHQEQNNDW